MASTGKIVGGVVVVAVVAGGAYALFANGQSKQADANTVTVGVVGDSDAQLWRFVAKEAKEKYGVTVKLKLFTDYIKPNTALIDGSIDLNSFQTLNYFKVQNKNLGNKLVSIGKTYITPIRLYSKTLSSLDALPSGAKIAVPNDASNEKRALDVLEDAGLLKYDHSVDLPTKKNITSNPKNLDITEVDSDQTASALSSVDAAVVNTNYALDAGLTDKEVLYTEPVNKSTAGYINLIVAKKGTQNTAAYKKVVKAYQSDATKKEMKKLYGDAEIAAWDIVLK
jgi:D-methionine transport system substrate-binding protein